MAKFETGTQKPFGSGRKRGTPNKKTLAVQDALEAHGIDLVDQITKLLPELCSEKRVDVLMGLMGYVYPRRKAVEISDVTNPQPGVVVILPAKDHLPSRSN